MKRNIFQGEVDRNYSAFKEILPNIIEEFQCKFALMQGGKIEDYFDTVSDAVKAGIRQHPDEIFSVQGVTNKKIDLGFFSHVA
jgi:hypothetical protein